MVSLPQQVLHVAVAFPALALQRASHTASQNMTLKWMCVVSPGEAELQGLLQVLPQTVLRILLLDIASC